MGTVKKIIVALLLFALCSYSAFKGMQTLSIVALILFLCSLYTNRIIILFDIFLSLAKHTKQAKIGGLEVSIADSFKQAVLDNINSNKEWVKAIVSDLTPTHLTILLAINLEGEYHCGYHIKNTLRELRAKGLIEHDKDTLESSDIVWLTDIGKKLVNEITTVK